MNFIPLAIYHQAKDRVVNNVIIAPVFGKEGIAYAKSIGAIFSLRNDYTRFHFGNPYSHNNKLLEKQDLILKDSIKESVLSYIDYLYNMPINNTDYINHSGGAFGADSEFDNIGRKFGFIKHNHYYYGNKTPKGNIQITANDYIEGLSKVEAVRKHRGYNKIAKDTILYLLSRNWQQVKHSKQIIAIARIQDGNPIGGTEWAITMAQLDIKQREIFVYDMLTCKWFYWSYNKTKWIETGIPILKRDYAGIGSQQLTTNGLQAIYNVYTKTYHYIENLANIKNVKESGILKNKKILYYKDIGELSHADILDFYLNNNIESCLTD